MRNQFLFLCLCLMVSASVSSQTFRWNDNTTAKTPAPTPKANDALADETGFAIHYADYLDGNPTALGEVYHHNLMTAGHKKLPLGTIVKITRLDNGQSTTVRINDRGAYGDDCVIDLSKAAAAQIGMLQLGRVRVKLTVMGYSNSNPPTPANYQPASSAQPQLTARSVAQPAAYAYETPKPSTSSNNTGMTAKTVTTQQPTPRTNSDNQPALQARGVPPTAVKNSTDEVAILANPISAFAVQLGSYGEFSNAERHVVALQRKGFNSIYVLQETRADGKLINRVIAAPFSSVTVAQNYLDDLRTYHQIEGLVVQMK